MTEGKEEVAPTAAPTSLPPHSSASPVQPHLSRYSFAAPTRSRGISRSSEPCFRKTLPVWGGWEDVCISGGMEEGRPVKVSLILEEEKRTEEKRQLVCGRDGERKSIKVSSTEEGRRGGQWCVGEKRPLVCGWERWRKDEILLNMEKHRKRVVSRGH